MNRKVSLTVLLLALCLSLLCTLRGDAATTSSQEIEKKLRTEEKRLQQIENQVAYHQRKIVETRKREKGLLDELSQYDEKAAVTDQKIRVLELKEKKAAVLLHDLQREIESTGRDIDRVKGLLASRLVSLYKYGNSAGLDLVLSAGNVQDALTMTYLLRRVAEQDELFFRELEMRKVRLGAALEEREYQKKLLEEQRTALNKEKVTYQDVSQKRSLSLKKIRQREESHRKAAEELHQTQQELEKGIRRLLQEKKNLAQTRQRDRKPLVPPKKGRLSWPVQGTVTSRFGMRVHPTFKTKVMHTGIDISAAQGTPVKAAAAGEVLFAGWLRGYGQIIVIDHGGDMTTVYAHLSRLLVEEGNRVAAGQTIGNVGSTGIATGPHLHFEVRASGDARDPLRYLGGR